MAKIIKYQLATEIPHVVFVEVPLLDEEGNPVVHEVSKQVYDDDGNPVFDENGEPVVEITYEPVFVKEERTEIEIVLSGASIKCATEEIFNANLPMVQKEAYNGEYTVEGEFDPEPEKPSGDSVWDELDAAYQRGVDSV